MTDLRLDLNMLQNLYVEINQIAMEFDSVKSVRHELSQAVGVYEGSDSDGLGHKVDSFSKGWDIRRGQILETLEAVRDAVKAIHNSFRDLDSTLTSVLTQQA